MIIKKLYLDIECCHNSGIIRKNEKWKFYDYANWQLRKGSVIGALGIGIDNTKMISKELLFKQFYGWDQKGIDELFGLFRRADMIVTFNGRNFDIPCILENFLNSDGYREKMLFELMGDKGKDRDLMDVYIAKKGPWIRGGLTRVAKNLGVNYDTNYADNTDIGKSVQIFRDWVGIDNETDERKAELQKIIDKNKNDIKILPLVEEKLGLFWAGRKDIDNYHKRWESFDKVLEKERNVNE